MLRLLLIGIGLLFASWALLAIQCSAGAAIHGTLVFLFRTSVYAEFAGYVARVWNRRTELLVAFRTS